MTKDLLELTMITLQKTSKLVTTRLHVEFPFSSSEVINNLSKVLQESEEIRCKLNYMSRSVGGKDRSKVHELKDYSDQIDTLLQKISFNSWMASLFSKLHNLHVPFEVQDRLTQTKSEIEKIRHRTSALSLSHTNNNSPLLSDVAGALQTHISQQILDYNSKFDQNCRNQQVYY